MKEETPEERIEAIKNAIKRYKEFGIKLWYCSDETNALITSIAIDDLEKQLLTLI